MSPKRLLRIAVPLLLVATTSPLLAQPSISADSAEAARFFAEGNWAGAAKVYDRITRADSTRLGAWMRLGTALDSLGRRRDAIRAYEGARRSGAPVAPAMFQLARAHAALGAGDRAVAYLDSAATNGYQGLDALRSAPELAPLRERPQYRAALARVESNRFPCRTNPQARQFDFWIGDWSVQIGGTEVGTNRIEHTIDQCALLENWETPGGPNGKSLNYWDPQLRRWKQIFIFDVGGVTDYTGEWKDGEMRFLSAPSLRASGATVHSRMTFIPMARDTVRQRIEVSSDSGRTWATGFDALYIRRRTPSP
jgi:tetratricopeptide (TPR) repeat protein